MSVRQYIGARYVTKIYQNSLNPSEAEWEAGVTYEPLTLVTYNYGSYLSKKDVPGNVGDPASNPDYWAQTGFYNGQIAMLDSRMTAAENDIIMLKDAAIRKYAIITDSYGVLQSPWTETFPTIFANLLDLTEGVDFCYRAEGGAGFVANTLQFTTVISNLASNMPGSMTPSDITDLIIAGGCNDSYITDHNALNTAINNTIAHAKSLFPNATVYIGVTGGLSNSLGRRQNMEVNVIPYYTNCDQYGAFSLGNLQYVMTNKSYFLADGTHPTQDGQNRIGAALASAMLTGYNKIDASPITVSGGAGTVSLSSGTVRVTNNMIDIDMRSLVIDFGDTATNVNHEYIACNFDNDVIFGNNVDWFPCRAYIEGGTDDSKQINAFIVFNEGDLLLEFPQNLNCKKISFGRIHAVTSTMNS